MALFYCTAAFDKVQRTIAALYKNAGNCASHYNFGLDFTNTKGWGFTFYDDDPDDYTVAAVRNGNHSVEYCSDSHNITSVS
ncbi:hypothetical protein V502_06403 [Pseudogymnoascus sp. VKM F-4520 (FW-2644)]|nr:hypothetical protein V502_06403 [Pseudogymnoascus sp. VKM F-4520 (FW-2644)]